MVGSRWDFFCGCLLGLHISFSLNLFSCQNKFLVKERDHKDHVWEKHLRVWICVMPILQGRKSHHSEYFKLRNLYLHLNLPHLVLTSLAVSSKSSVLSIHWASNRTCSVWNLKDMRIQGSLWVLLLGSLPRCLHFIPQNTSLCSCISSHLAGEAFKHHPQLPKLLVPDPEHTRTLLKSKKHTVFQQK